MFGIPDIHIDRMIAVNDELVENPGDSVMEECGELISAIAKQQSGRVSYDEGMKRIKEEMTHVLTSMWLMARLYGITENDILKEVVLKAVKGDFDIEPYGYKPKERDV